jgi:U3 small nucleolar RNA-associated protein 7
MDVLTSAADAIKPLNAAKKRGGKGKGREHKPKSNDVDPTLHSVSARAGLPRSMRPDTPESKIRGPYSHIKDKKLKAKLHSQVAQASQAKALREDATTWLAAEQGGRMEVETELERTWKTTQMEIVEAAGEAAVTGRKEWRWDVGPYRVRYSRNGRYVYIDVCWDNGAHVLVRHMAVAGRKGHVITSEWQEDKIHSEIQLRETVRDIT